MNTHEAKANVRHKIAARRAELAAEDRRVKEASINERLLKLFEDRYGAGQTFMTYMPMGSEPDITPVMEWCWTQGVRVVLPRTIRGTRDMALHEATSYDQLTPGMWGIREPLPTLPVLRELSDVGVILVPGLAFDARFGRLGYGGGYYDRLFASYDRRELNRPLLLAAAFDLQIEQELPLEEHDVRMDRIITESLDLVSQAARGR